MVLSKYALSLVGLLLLSSGSISAENVNVALHCPVIASSEQKEYPVKNVTDGIISRASSWISGNQARPPHSLDVNLEKYCDIHRIVIYTGIPEKEKLQSEKEQAPGFWSMKNLKIQYWDDANWTDLPNTEITENRLDQLEFLFKPVLTTFQIRLISTDGEPIRINEIEVYGKVKSNMPVPTAVNSAINKPTGDYQKEISATITNRVIGKSMKYVGYNQGYYFPGSNISGWLEYAQVNSLRVWTSLNDYVAVSSVHTDKQLQTLADFEAYKKELRDAPEHNRFIKWQPIVSECVKAKFSTNAMVFEYALQELKRLEIDVVLQMNSTDFKDNWANKWQQWQRYYALAFYAAKTGDVTMFAMQNEPNHRHSGPLKIPQYVEGMRLVSDAVHCAVQDVNRLYRKNLKAQFVSPVTAGSNANWWAAVVKNMRIDYRGLPTDRDLIDVFSTHSYNLPAAGYVSKVSDIRKLIIENHPLGNPLPIVYTETGRWMNAYLIDKEETMNTPSLFTEWAGEYTNNTINQGYGMWAFKFANTTSGTYPRGIKSGHHFIWQGKRWVEDAYENVALGKRVFDVTSSVPAAVKMVTDGDKTDRSTWTSPNTEKEKCLEIDLKKECTLGGAVLYTGSAYGVYTGPDRVKNSRLQYWTGSNWADITDTKEESARYTQLFYAFDQPVRTSKIRFLSSDKGSIKVREIKLFTADSMKEVPASYDVSGIQRTGEVVRLFAKGFKEERPLLDINRSVADHDVDMMASFDPKAMTYYVWLVQRKVVPNQLTLELSGLNLPPSTTVIAEEVSDVYDGGVKWVKELSPDGKLSFDLPVQSVILLTIPIRSSANYKEWQAIADAKVVSGKSSNKNFGKERTMSVAMNASDENSNQVSYITFDLENLKPENLNAAVLKLKGGCKEGDYRMHVYALYNTNWNENTLTWNTAPNIDREQVRITDVGRTAHVAGQLSFSSPQETRMLDVTSLIRNCHSERITFILIREVRQLGDDADKNKVCSLQTRETSGGPVLLTW